MFCTHQQFKVITNSYCWECIKGYRQYMYIAAAAATAAKSLQSCPTLCDPIDGSPPGSPVPGILQARILEWVAISFSNAWKWKVKVKSFSRIRLLATPWTAAYQAPPSMGFSRQEYWSGVPLLSPCVQPVGYECKNCLPRVSLILCALILTIFSLICLGNIIQYSHSKKVTRLCKVIYRSFVV